MPHLPGRAWDELPGSRIGVGKQKILPARGTRRETDEVSKEVCGATLACCRCHKAPHGRESAHVCGERSLYGMGCGGSWRDTDDPDNPEIVAYPLMNLGF